MQADSEKFPPQEQNINLFHLLAELSRIDVLLRRQVFRWQLAGQNPKDDFRGLYVSDGEAQALLKRPVTNNWGDAASLDPQQERFFAEQQVQAAQRTQQLSEQAQRAGIRPRLDSLKSAFNLSPFEVDTLLICLAPQFDLRYERLYGYLQDDVTRKRPTVNLVLDLLCEPGVPRL